MHDFCKTFANSLKAVRKTFIFRANCNLQAKRKSILHKMFKVTFTFLTSTVLFSSPSSFFIMTHARSDDLAFRRFFKGNTADERGVCRNPRGDLFLRQRV